MNMPSLRFVVLASAISLAGCGDDDYIPPGTGTSPLSPDAGSPDAGADASVPPPADAGVADASPEPLPDAGAAPADAGADAAAPASASLAVGERPESAQFDPATNAW